MPFTTGTWAWLLHLTSIQSNRLFSGRRPLAAGENCRFFLSLVLPPQSNQQVAGRLRARFILPIHSVLYFSELYSLSVVLVERQIHGAKSTQCCPHLCLRVVPAGQPIAHAFRVDRLEMRTSPGRLPLGLAGRSTTSRSPELRPRVPRRFACCFPISIGFGPRHPIQALVFWSP